MSFTIVTGYAKRNGFEILQSVAVTQRQTGDRLNRLVESLLAVAIRLYYSATCTSLECSVHYGDGFSEACPIWERPPAPTSLD